jgi:hypothetical protein
MHHRHAGHWTARVKVVPPLPCFDRRWARAWDAETRLAGQTQRAPLPARSWRPKFFWCRSNRTGRSDAGHFRSRSVRCSSLEVSPMLDSASFFPACHAGGRGFKSRRSRHYSRTWLFPERRYGTFGPAPIDSPAEFSGQRQNLASSPFTESGDSRPALNLLPLRSAPAARAAWRRGARPSPAAGRRARLAAR